ncbi:AAA family ATPase [Halonotius aquaticus]|uniref:AAA family ATPase n=1 Tax=Halonotius aquaticus TaxID=2216978 RepID=A0A3A6QA68_9EURY|nr:AAA family ATPase [Halonotius aquaticus]RJX42767.1 AAA family ATPase [Halonotius aquaticus]
MSDDEGLGLTVKSAEKRDAGRGIARLSERAIRELGVLSGDTVVIEGTQATVAKVWPGGHDVADGTVRIDADTRANADVKVGQQVRVRKESVAEATAVTLQAPEELGTVDIDHETIETAVKRGLRDRPIRTGEGVRIERLAGSRFVVTDTDPDGTVRVSGSTTVTVSPTTGSDAGESAGDKLRKTVDRATGAGGDDAPQRPETGVTYEDIGGLDEELELVREMIELPLSEPEVFTRLGVDPPKGVLLHGPPGTGKTLIAKAVANEVDATFLTVSGPEIMSKYKGESEEKLREKFEAAAEDAPAIVFFDEIDSIAGKRDDGGDVESRVVGQLLSLMDGLDARGDVIVIGATNRVDSLDPALRRGGRFDREIEIGVPGEAGRREVLDVHTRRMPLAEDVDIDTLAARTHGFVGADLEGLAKEAAMTALRRTRQAGDDLRAVEVTREDFETAMTAVEPSAMREYVAEQPTTDFDDVGGLTAVKEQLEQAVTWPLQYGPLFDAADTTPPTGVLLHGPPGTGKTLLARAIAGESEVNFIQVRGPELLDRYVGESEKAVREVFERARQSAPAIIFFDEIDAIAGDRDGLGGDSGVGDRVVSQLLTELDRLNDTPNLVVLAATNRRESIDGALLRSGRLERSIEVPNPDRATRQAVLDVHTRTMQLADDVDLDVIAASTEGASSADLTSICREASLLAITELTEQYEGATANDHADELEVTAAHFEAAKASVLET